MLRSAFAVLLAVMLPASAADPDPATMAIKCDADIV